MEIGIRPDPASEIHLQIGGDVRRIHFAEATLRLCPPNVVNPPECPIEETLQWRTSVGFFQEWSDPRWLVVLGQCGFFDQFTITMSRHAQHLAISHRDDFDERHATTGTR